MLDLQGLDLRVLDSEFQGLGLMQGNIGIMEKCKLVYCIILQ